MTQMKNSTHCFDEKCLELARYFYPDETDDNLRPLAQLLQDSVEEFSPLGPRAERPLLPLDEHLAQVDRVSAQLRAAQE